MPHFSVELETFRGPLDLLLYLVRKHEVEIAEIPICDITDQYLEYMGVLEQVDVNAVGDFLEMASTLIEIKSRLVLPRAGEEEGELDDPQQDLVRRLLEYKKFRDAASMLEEQGRAWQEHYARRASDLPPRERDLASQPIHEVELWDLVSAFGRVLRDNTAQKASNIVYDDTPIHVYMRQITERLERDGRIRFFALFADEMHKSQKIGIFLALLELVRHHHIKSEQNELFGEIWILPGSQSGQELDTSLVDGYEHGASAAG
ncbi:MAG: chromosome segregation protein ScpA [Planctomycetota bacterium]|nr:MAG: chromosome segregation protein ScpA [Planctomycetota bacterium]REJ86694.1 MAG: chromosome segregation protein ScpA [Planctomycetota bacterium]REK27134.1 MAG: chromosome segregation protein ScpA [Planctomycetota bacterium]REK37869.1 MAG: chromosome segregation protein ScpA [Planctomycetota bacterium]